MPPEVPEVTPTFSESLRELMAQAESEGHLTPPFTQLFANIITGFASLPQPERPDVIRSTSSPLLTISSPKPLEGEERLFSYHYRQKDSMVVRIIITPLLEEASSESGRNYPSDQCSLHLVTQEGKIQVINMTNIKRGVPKTSIIYTEGEWEIINPDQFKNRVPQILNRFFFLCSLVQYIDRSPAFKRPTQISPKLLSGLADLSKQTESQGIFKREESLELFALLLTLYDLPTLTGKGGKTTKEVVISPNPQRGIKSPGIYRVTKMEEVGETRFILIPREHDEIVTLGEEQIEISLVTDKSDDIIEVRLRYSTYIGHIIVKYSEQSWNLRSDNIPWEIGARILLWKLEEITLHLHEILQKEPFR